MKELFLVRALTQASRRVQWEKSTKLKFEKFFFWPRGDGVAVGLFGDQRYQYHHHTEDLVDSIEVFRIYHKGVFVSKEFREKF